MESGLTMKCDSGIEVKERQIIRLSDSSRAWVVIAVTQKEIDDDKDGINTDAPGLHCFGGMWYGDDPAKRSSFGKIQKGIASLNPCIF